MEHLQDTATHLSDRVRDGDRPCFVSGDVVNNIEPLMFRPEMTTEKMHNLCYIK